MSPEMVVPWLVLGKATYEALKPVVEAIIKRVKARRARRAKAKRPC